MKKRYITAVCCLLAAVLTSLCAISQARQQRLAEKLIRLHIVANSDTREDQRVKLLVRDAVLETANGLLRDAQNPEAALQTGLPELERVEFVGLCTDICVITNAMMTKGALPEIPLFVREDCCAGVTPESHETALNAMKMCQISIL